MKLAVDASQRPGEAEAWTHVQLGKLYWSVGRIGAAEREDRAALAVFPATPTPSTRSRASRRRRATTARAIALEQQAVDRIPLPQYVSQLGDLYRATGQARRRAGSTR